MRHLRRDDFEHQATDLALSPTKSEFTLGKTRFEISLIGELNVRNALGVVACARHCGISDAQIQSALSSFMGVKRRMEVRGVRGGVTVVDDFAHQLSHCRNQRPAAGFCYGQRTFGLD